jgi:hypothetical protein
MATKLEIKEEYFPTRCEICHQSDCFDYINNTCSRCNKIGEVFNSSVKAANDDGRKKITIKQKSVYERILFYSILIPMILGGLFFLIFVLIPQIYRVEFNLFYLFIYAFCTLLGGCLFAFVGAVCGFIAGVLIVITVFIIKQIKRIIHFYNQQMNSN